MEHEGITIPELPDRLFSELRLRRRADEAPYPEITMGIVFALRVAWVSAITGPTHCTMNTITLSWEDWRAVIAVMREYGLPYELEHADHIEELLEQHAPDAAMVTLYLADDVYLRSYNGARLRLGIPLPPMQR